jgi:hypothetical protein
MRLQIIRLRERFVTHITGIWALSAVSALMFLQVTQTAKCFIAHTTRKWTFSIMYAYMLLQPILMTE